MAGHKRQHFIPAFYLRAWCDPDTPAGETPYVRVFEKDGNRSRRKSPQNIFHESDMYSLPSDDGTRDFRVEEGLQVLESMFASIRDSTLTHGNPLSEEDHVVFCAFLAAMKVRTLAHRDHQRRQWGHALRMMEDAKSALDNAPPERREHMIAALRSPVEPSGDVLTYDHVKELAANPVQRLLAPTMRELTPLLCELNLAIFETADEIGFITSDRPCVWFDPYAYRQHPLFRAPTITDPSIEISFPISPKQCAYLNRQGIVGYLEATPAVVNELNRRTRFRAKRHFIVRKNTHNPSWFERGTEPDDSWEKTHPAKDAR